jgi:hypothetical protein
MRQLIETVPRGSTRGSVETGCSIGFLIGRDAEVNAIAVGVEYQDHLRLERGDEVPFSSGARGMVIYVYRRTKPLP